MDLETLYKTTLAREKMSEAQAHQKAFEFWKWFTESNMFTRYADFVDSEVQTLRFDSRSYDFLDKLDLICVKEEIKFNEAGKYLQQTLMKCSNITFSVVSLGSHMGDSFRLELKFDHAEK